MHGRNELEEKHTSKLLIFLKLVRVSGAAHQTLVSSFNRPATVKADAWPRITCFLYSMCGFGRFFEHKRLLARPQHAYS